MERDFRPAAPDRLYVAEQTELLDRSTWPTREGLAQALFAFIEGFYNPRRRHSTLGFLSPADYQQQHKAGRHAETAA